MKHSEITKEKIRASMSKYLKEHPDHISLHYWEGKKMKTSTKKKMSISAKNSINPGKFKVGQIPWNRDKVLSEELKSRISKTLEGNKLSKKTRLKISKSNIGKHSTSRTSVVAYEKILKEIPELENQGFRCVPIGKIIPDIIAIKDGLIYAIEVESSRNPNYKKYNNYPFVDDVIWILKHPHASRE